MRRWYLLLLIVLIPVVAFANVWQVFRYKQLENCIKQLEAVQKEYIEKNKRLIAGIAVLQSPRRLEEIAREELGLSKLEPGRIIRIFIPKREDKNDR
jgi:cell division protein FtsL